ncbi:hypothetical protein [Actinoplanes sp. NPDC020271]|uniref:hypothetical protein n=1 Tax=Actinoplanes sp. NPDC020271 TaxID=3363896 RepID=UPI0037963C69
MARTRILAVSLVAVGALVLQQNAAVAAPVGSGTTAPAPNAAAVSEARAAIAAAAAKATAAETAKRASDAAAASAVDAASRARAAAAAARAALAAAAAEAAEEERLDAEVSVGLSIIENIPDEIENDEAAVQAYLDRETAVAQSELGSAAATATGTVHAFSSTWGCVSAVVIALASNVFSISKILKIKRIIKAVGGVKKVVKKVRAVYKEARKAKYSKTDALRLGVMEAVGGLGTEAVSLLLSFFSLDKVYSNCF